VDCRDDSLASFACQFLEELHDGQSAETVEARSRLVKEKHRWVSDQLYADRCAFPLTTGDDFAIYISDLRASTALEAKLVDQLADSLVLPIDWHVELEACCELKGFLHGKVGKKDVILHDIGANVTK